MAAGGAERVAAFCARLMTAAAEHPSDLRARLSPYDPFMAPEVLALWRNCNVVCKTWIDLNDGTSPTLQICLLRPDPTIPASLLINGHRVLVTTFVTPGGIQPLVIESESLAGYCTTNDI